MRTIYPHGNERRINIRKMNNSKLITRRRAVLGGLATLTVGGGVVYGVSTLTSNSSSPVPAEMYAATGTGAFGIELSGHPIMGARDVPIDIYYWSEYQYVVTHLNGMGVGGNADYQPWCRSPKPLVVSKILTSFTLPEMGYPTISRLCDPLSVPRHDSVGPHLLRPSDPRFHRSPHRWRQPR